MGLYCILRDYFGVNGEPPIYDEDDFERRFRVPRSVFVRIYRAVRDRPGFRQAVHATGRPQAHPLEKVVAAFRVLAYGEAADRADEYVRLARSTVDVATRKLVEFIVSEYEPLYLRPPNDEELTTILRRNAERGLPGCMGSLDCSHWEWRACPKGLAGIYQNRKQRRTIIMETVCDEDLYIWHLFVGAPGSFNDLNVLQQSPLYQDVTAGLWPPRKFTFTANGRARTLLYYLVDSIYAHYAFSVRPYPTTTTRKQKTFNRLQEAVRKDAERLYAVLTARFHVALHPARMGTVPQITTVAKAVCILHNMVTEMRRDGYFSRTRTGYGAGAAVSGATAGGAGGAAMDGTFAGVGGPGGGGAAAAGQAAGLGGGGVLPALGIPPPAVVPIAQSPYVRAMLAWREVRSEREHVALRDDLAEHVWAEREKLLAPYL